jgi:hypothetical protein
MKYIIPVILCLLFTGCKSSDVAKEQKQKQKIERIEDGLNKTNLARLEKIGEYSYGVGIALAPLPRTNEVNTAFILNERIQTLSEKPTLDAMKEIASLVAQLNTNNMALLNQKDSEIIRLQTAIKRNNDTLDSERTEYYQLSKEMAGDNDKYKRTMDGFLGLSAIWYGLKKFLLSAVWILGGGFILFTILRVLSMSNPIAASIFSIANVAGSWLLNTIKKLVPGAISLSGLVHSTEHESYLSTLDKIIDSIELIKDRESNGKPQTTEDLLSQIEKITDTSDKQIIEKCKKELLWK